jgi:hypothetical protein
MEELRVTNLLGGALAAISGAVVGIMSIFTAVATAGYARSLASAPQMAAPQARPSGGR